MIMLRPLKFPPLQCVQHPRAFNRFVWAGAAPELFPVTVPGRGFDSGECDEWDQWDLWHEWGGHIDSLSMRLPH